MSPYLPLFCYFREYMRISKWTRHALFLGNKSFRLLEISLVSQLSFVLIKEALVFAFSLFAFLLLSLFFKLCSLRLWWILEISHNASRFLLCYDFAFPLKNKLPSLRLRECLIPIKHLKVVFIFPYCCFCIIFFLLLRCLLLYHFNSNTMSILMVMSIELCTWLQN